MNWKHIFFLSLFFYFHTQKVSSQANLVINEVMTANISVIPDEYEADPSNCPVTNCYDWYKDLGESVYDGDYPGWVEIYNNSASTINLSGYSLSDDSLQPGKWLFPNNDIAPGQFILVFTSGKDRKINVPPDAYLHANFKLAIKGESIILAKEGVIIDKKLIPEMPRDYSIGRTTDGNKNWSVFVSPTPLANNAGNIFTSYSDILTPNFAPGIYPNSILFEIENIVLDGSIKYSIDGSDITPLSDDFPGFIGISKPTVIKMQSYKNNVAISPVYTWSYIINANHTLPVISLSTDPDNLWDDNTGIYTGGPNLDETNRLGNYWNDWERPAHIELFETNNSNQFSIPAGIKIFGWGSRTNERKSLAIMVRDKYGAKALEYPLFGENYITKFNSFILRDGGQDWQSTLMRDPMIVRLTNNFDLEQQAGRYCIVYLNGDYYGIYNIREKLNEDYLNNHRNIDKDYVDIISRYWRRTYPIIVEGNSIDYSLMEDFFRESDMSIESNYALAKELMDVNNFMIYSAINIYAGNYDWPGNNNKCWRSTLPESKWRWFMYDLDYTFALNSFSQYNINTLEHATEAGNAGWPNPDFSTLLLRGLLKNENFKNAFINQMCDLINYNFEDTRLNNEIDSMMDELRPEMQNHIDRWGYYETTLTSISDWENNVDDIRDFNDLRPATIHSYMKTMFNLGARNSLTINIDPPEGGKVMINSIPITSGQWTGEYYNGIPVTISVIPNTGYEFTEWVGVSTASKTNSPLSFDITNGTSITASFTEKPDEINQIIINEINYNSSINHYTGDWIELYNSYAIDIDISGWKIHDKKENHFFTIPYGTVIPAHSFLVICENISLFKNLNPTVSNCIGDMQFGFSSNGELIRLLNSQGEVVDSVRYGTFYPWTDFPNGNGPTLSLISPELDNSLASSWGSSASLGTPGTHNLLSQSEENNLMGDFIIYPNPLKENESINILFSNYHNYNSKLNIYTLSGNLVYTSNIDIHSNAQLITLPLYLVKGIYLIQLKNEDINHINKLIIQ